MGAHLWWGVLTLCHWSVVAARILVSDRQSSQILLHHCLMCPNQQSTKMHQDYAQAGGGSGCLQPLHPLLPAAALQHNPACMHHLPTRPPATVSLVTASPTSFDLQSWRWRLQRGRWWQCWLAGMGIDLSVGAVCLVMACLSAYVACDPVLEGATPLPPASALVTTSV